MVDGLSGATITSRGVDSMLKYWFSKEGFGPYIRKLASEQGEVAPAEDPSASESDSDTENTAAEKAAEEETNNETAEEEGESDGSSNG